MNVTPTMVTEQYPWHLMATLVYTNDTTTMAGWEFAVKCNYTNDIHCIKSIIPHDLKTVKITKHIDVYFLVVTIKSLPLT